MRQFNDLYFDEKVLRVMGLTYYTIYTYASAMLFPFACIWLLRKSGVTISVEVDSVICLVWYVFNLHFVILFDPNKIKDL